MSETSVPELVEGLSQNAGVGVDEKGNRSCYCRDTATSRVPHWFNDNVRLHASSSRLSPSAPMASDLRASLRSLGLGDDRIQQALDVGCQTAEEALAFLFEGHRPPQRAQSQNSTVSGMDTSSGWREKDLSQTPPARASTPAQEDDYPESRFGASASQPATTVTSKTPGIDSRGPTSHVSGAKASIGGANSEDAAGSSALHTDPTSTSFSPSERDEAKAQPAAWQPASSAASSVSASSQMHLGGTHVPRAGTDVNGIKTLVNTSEDVQTSGARSYLGSSGHKGGRSVSFAPSKEEEDLQKALELSRQTEVEEAAMRAALDQSNQAPVSGRNNSASDPDLIMAIQRSLGDTSGKGETMWEASIADENPSERVRETPATPVGLRNIGNTCYLNSLLQVYFHIPQFRKIVLEYDPPKSVLDALQARTSADTEMIARPAVDDVQTVPESVTTSLSASTLKTPTRGQSAPTKAVDAEGLPPIKETSSVPPQATQSGAAASDLPSTNIMSQDVQNHDTSQQPSPAQGQPRQSTPADETAYLTAVEFVVELQRLFARMALGNESFADPTALFRAMRDANGNRIAIGGQQDASEFNWLFLDIVERALTKRPDSKHAQTSVGSSEEGAASSLGATTGVSDQGVASRADTAGEELNAIRNMFSATFNQSITVLDERSGRTDCADTRTPEPIAQPTAALVIDATGSTHRDLMRGLDDYSQTKIEYALSGGDDPGGSSGSNCKLTSDDVDMGSVSGSSVRALKTVWFTRFAPVLTLYLQKTRYNRETSKVEKVHDRYSFTPEIFVDRYLEKNREASDLARKKANALRDERFIAESGLRRLIEFGSEPSTDEAGSSNEQESAADKTRGKPSESDLPIGKTVRENDSRGANGKDESLRVPVSIAATLLRAKRRLEAATDPSATITYTPSVSEKDISQALQTLDAVLKRDSEHLDGLRTTIGKLKDDEEKVYKDLSNEKYSLQAVLVHDGEPMSGHYWTFIRNGRRARPPGPPDDAPPPEWLKFNDMRVSGVSEEEMLQSSQGGSNRASAYCLIYMSEEYAKACQSGSGSQGDKVSMDIDGAAPDPLREEALEFLPKVRIEEVEASNKSFEQKVTQHAAEKRIRDREKKASIMVATAASCLKQATETMNATRLATQDATTDLATVSTSAAVQVSCGARSIVEFSLFTGFHPCAVLYAVSMSWEAHLQNSSNDVPNLFEFLKGEEGQLVGFPELSKEPPVPTTNEEELRLVLVEVCKQLTQNPGHITKSDFKDIENACLYVSNVLQRPQQVSVLLEQAQKAREWYMSAIRGLTVVTSAANAAFNKQWVDSIALFSSILKKDPLVYRGDSSGPDLATLEQTFAADSAFSLYRREAEASRIMGSVLDAVATSVQGSKTPEDDVTAQRRLTAYRQINWLVRDVIDVLRNRAAIEKTALSMRGQRSDGVEGATVAAAEKVLKELSKFDLTDRPDAPEIGAHEKRAMLLKAARHAADAQDTAASAAAYEKARNELHNFGCYSGEGAMLLQAHPGLYPKPIEFSPPA